MAPEVYCICTSSKLELSIRRIKRSSKQFGSFSWGLIRKTCRGGTSFGFVDMVIHDGNPHVWWLLWLLNPCRAGQLCHSGKSTFILVALAPGRMVLRRNLKKTTHSRTPICLGPGITPIWQALNSFPTLQELKDGHRQEASGDEETLRGVRLPLRYESPGSN